MTARETILDAAAAVMRDKGIARATTKEIAREAGYSEALLYKHFADKQAIYMGVLKERLGGMTVTDGLIGTGTVEGNLATITVNLMAFYVQSFPMFASIFSDRELLVSWRESLPSRGGGPRTPVTLIELYLQAERALGRVDDIDVASVSELLCGAALQQAFLACFEGLDAVPDARIRAERLVSVIRLER